MVLSLAVGMAALAVWGLYWRGRYARLERELQAYRESSQQATNAVLHTLTTVAKVKAKGEDDKINRELELRVLSDTMRREERVRAAFVQILRNRGLGEGEIGEVMRAIDGEIEECGG